MKQADEELRKLVKRWIAKAETDYITARQLAENAGAFIEPISFHCG